MKIPGLGIGEQIQDLPWKTTQIDGIHWLPLHLDRNDPKQSAGALEKQQREGATVLIRMAPGASYGAHRHLGAEDVLVLRGGYRDEMGQYAQGEHIHYAPGSCHTPVALGDSAQPISVENPECVLFAVASGGIELLGRDES